MASALIEVAPNGGPPLHVHHKQEETIHVLKGRFKVRIGDELFQLDEGGFAYLPSQIPHAVLNLTDQPAEIIVVYTPGGGHKFYEELGPATRNGTPDRAVVASIFDKHDMTLLGPATARRLIASAPAKPAFSTPALALRRGSQLIRLESPNARGKQDAALASTG